MKTKFLLLSFVILLSLGAYGQSLTVTSTLPATIETGDPLSFTVNYDTNGVRDQLILYYYESDGTTRTAGSPQGLITLTNLPTGSETVSMDVPLVAGNYEARVFLQNSVGYAKTETTRIPFTVTSKVYPIKTAYLFETDGDLEGWVVGTTGGGPSGPTATVASDALTFGRGGTNYGTTYVQQNTNKLDPTVHSYVHITYNKAAWNSNVEIGLDWIKSGTTRSSDSGANITILNNPGSFQTVTYNLSANTEWIDGATVADATNFRIYYRKAGSSTSGGDLIVDSIIFSSTATAPNVFTAAIDNDFTNDANWSSGTAPTTTEAIIIPADKGVDVTNLTVDPAGSLTIESGGSLKVSGTASGNITYNRTVDFVAGNLKGWFLMGAPVASQDYDDAFVTANDIATSGTNRGIATYTTASDSWLYHQGAASATFTAGTGYAVKRQTRAGTVAFTGTLNVNNAGVTVPLSRVGNRINLLGNPYTAYVKSATFLDNEIAISDTKTMWVFNKDLGVNGQYEVKTVGQAFILAPGQGFFIQANATGTDSFNFSEANQSHNGTDTFQKTANVKGEVTLSITDGTIKNYGKVFYVNNATKSLDIGYDGELFSGQTTDFAIYTHLVSNNIGKKYQVQALPNSDYENMIIPVGVKAAAGKEITFSATSLNLPTGIKVFLEDRENNTFTRLDEANSTYKVTLTEAANDVGRFFVHTRSSALSTDNIALDNISIFKTDNNTLRIVGVQQGVSNVRLYSILGKQMMNTSFNANGVKDIALPKLATGVYIVQLETETGSVNKKIILE